MYLYGMDGLEGVDAEPALLELAFEDLHLALLGNQLPRLGDLGRLHVGVQQVLVHHRRDLNTSTTSCFTRISVANTSNQAQASTADTSNQT